jgi:hypothetical protein
VRERTLGAAPSGRAVLWISFNIVLFSAYALFGVFSLFLPEPLETPWLYPLHLAGLLFTLAILYGLVKRKYWTVFLLLPFSVGMILHLGTFIIYPLSMAIAYIGPSRSFIALMSFTLSRIGAVDLFSSFFIAFNSAMIMVHLTNIVFFLRKNTAILFKKGSEAIPDRKNVRL